MNPENPLRHTKHIFRAFLLLTIFIIALILGRSLFVPDSWGQYGWFRGASVDEHRDLPLKHGGTGSCGECHDGELETLTQGGHSSLQCELCHAPLAAHVVDDEIVAEMAVPENAEFCVQCHQRLVARPHEFPQVLPRQHVEENGGEFSETACFDCHEPHAPL
jgi:hypothetical protein